MQQVSLFARWALSVFALALGRPALALEQPTPNSCPRPEAGSVVTEPHELRSAHGRLMLDLAIENSLGNDGKTRYCYRLGDGAISPTLRVKPGDWLVLKLDNRLVDLDGTAEDPVHEHHHTKDSVDACHSGVMSLISTNLHFHGLSVPSVCHQDEVLHTSIAPGAPPFEYRFRIPEDEAPGLYWYHPHMHGFSAKQVSGGASGALVVEGLERSIPEVAGLPERVIVIRDQDVLHPDATPSQVDASTTPFVDHDGDAGNTGTDSADRHAICPSISSLCPIPTIRRRPSPCARASANCGVS